MIPDRRSINGVTYCLGSAGSFILHCPKCTGPDDEGRFRGEPNNPLERCWTCKGPMEPLTESNIHIYRWLWGEILAA
jgi:hypothetical protein